MLVDKNDSGKENELDTTLGEQVRGTLIEIVSEWSVQSEQ